jgi:hypothetical protein
VIIGVRRVTGVANSWNSYTFLIISFTRQDP